MHAYIHSILQIAKSIFLFYLFFSIANNLYGHAMSQHLPIGKYEWVDIDNFDKTRESQESSIGDYIMNLPDDSDVGYIFDVDLDYPESIHAAHNDFPFCAEKRMLPTEAIDIVEAGARERMKNAAASTIKTEKNQGERGIRANKIEKLLLTLYDKKNYILHYRMLKLALRHGLVLKKVNRILKFKQSLWLKVYIDLNTEMRTKAQNVFDRDFYKLMNNSIYGKMMENLRARIDIKLVNKWGGRCGAGMLIARPNFKKCKIFDEELVAFEMRKTRILMNKPIIVGMCVLDISKLTMYSFLYDFLKPKYGDKCKVAYTDTDSFVLDIETDDFYTDMSENIDMFDTSDYPQPNKYNIESKNKKVPGLFKDELNGEIMTEFVGLRAKCYAVRSLGYKKSYYEKIKKSKGIKKSVIKQKIKFDDYLNCIRNQCEFRVKQRSIRSINHNVYSIEQQKVGLSPFDDKRYIVKPAGIDTFAWGHYIVDMHEELE